jgi:hypothetical protein
VQVNLFLIIARSPALYRCEQECKQIVNFSLTRVF